MIYAKKINGKQRKALTQLENISGFEPLHQDELDAGTMSFKEVWDNNISWLESMLADASNINLEGCYEES